MVQLKERLESKVDASQKSPFPATSSMVFSVMYIICKGPKVDA